MRLLFRIAWLCVDLGIWGLQQRVIGSACVGPCWCASGWLSATQSLLIAASLRARPRLHRWIADCWMCARRLLGRAELFARTRPRSDGLQGAQGLEARQSTR